MTTTIQRISRGAGWIYTYRWLDRLLSFVSIVVLARLLAPEDFGVVAIAASVVAILEGLSDFDVNRALIRARSEDRELYDSAWTLSVLRGVAAALLMVVVAPFIDDGRIRAILLVLSISPLLHGLSNPRFVMFERHLIYPPLAVQTLSAKLISFGVTLAIALMYRSYWALVLGIIASSLTSAILTYVLRPFRPRVSFSRFSEIFAFSGWMSLTTMVTTLSMQTDRIIVGRLLGVADAGAYYMTQRVGVVPTAELISPLQRILFPSFSEIAEDRERLRRAVRESINILGSLSLPAGVGFALVANDFVPLALGATWTMIVPLLQVLVPFLGVRAALSMTLPCVMALGRTRLLFGVSLVYALIHLPAFIAGTALYGLPGAIWSIVLAGIAYSLLNAWMLHRTLGISISEILAQLRRPFLAVGLMTMAIFAADYLLPLDLFTERGSWLPLVIKVVLGGTVFCASDWLLWKLEGRPAGIEHRLRQFISR